MLLIFEFTIAHMSYRAGNPYHDLQIIRLFDTIVGINLQKWYVNWYDFEKIMNINLNSKIVLRYLIRVAWV